MKKLFTLGLALFGLTGLASCTDNNNGTVNGFASSETTLKIQAISAMNVIQNASTASFSTLKKVNNRVDPSVKEEISDNLQTMDMLMTKGSIEIESTIESVNIDFNGVILDTKETYHLADDQVYTLYYSSADKFERVEAEGNWQHDSLTRDDDWDRDEFEIETIQYIKGISFLNEEKDAEGNLNFDKGFPFESKLVEEKEDDEVETERKLRMFISADSYVEVEEETEIEGRETSYEISYELYNKNFRHPSYSFEIELESEDANQIEFRINNHEYEVFKFVDRNSNATRFRVEFEDEVTDQEEVLLFEKVETENTVSYQEI